MSYKFDHAWKRERERLAQIEMALDPWTHRAIETTSPKNGWRCLEVGAGGGSIAAWLCERVGPSGHVVATDIETDFLEALDAPNLERRRHNIVSDPLEEDHYDLVHARAVLDHLPERDAVIFRLVAALKRGGWLVIEAADFSSVRAVGQSEEDAAFFDRAFASMIKVWRQAGADAIYGRRLGLVFRSAGLKRVSVEGMLMEWGADHPLAGLYGMTFQRLKEPALAAKALDADAFERLTTLMRSPQFRAISHTMFSVCGQKPLD